MELKENDIVNVINDIKNDILSIKHKIFENANNELLGLYFRIGKYIYENSKYGSKFIDNLSDIATPDKKAILEGKNMFIILAPSK